MELKPELVMEILKGIEQSPSTRKMFAELVPLGESREQVFYHVWLMQREGLLDFLGEGSRRSERYREPIETNKISTCWLLTPGHDLLLELQAPGVFHKIKDAIKDQAIPVSTGLLLALAKKYTKELLGLAEVYKLARE
jgi:hypothetical protein